MERVLIIKNYFGKKDELKENAKGVDKVIVEGGSTTSLADLIYDLVELGFTFSKIKIKIGEHDIRILEFVRVGEEK